MKKKPKTIGKVPISARTGKDVRPKLTDNKTPTEKEKWLSQIRKLLMVRRSCEVGESEALSFILREGFQCDFYATPSGLVRIKRLDIHGRR